MTIQFINAKHKQFYLDCVQKANAGRDPYRKALFYAIGTSEDARAHVNELYNFDERGIILEGLNKAWQSSSSLNACRLAFNLYNGYHGGSLEDAANYTPYAICDTGNLIWTMQAIYIRYEG